MFINLKKNHKPSQKSPLYFTLSLSIVLMTLGQLKNTRKFQKWLAIFPLLPTLSSMLKFYTFSVLTTDMNHPSDPYIRTAYATYPSIT